jgi:hypothetical protein
MNLHPFDEVAKNAESKIREGWEVYQQFNCAGCGVKQTMDDKNIFHTRGRCEECGHVTDIRKDGCNFMAMLSMK